MSSSELSCVGVVGVGCRWVQPPFDVGGGHGASEEVALREGVTGQPEALGLLRCFDPFGHCLQAQSVDESDEVLHDDGAGAVGGASADEGLVDLEDVDRAVQQHITDAGSLLGARTRFQIAVLAAKRGWLTDQGDSVQQPEVGVPG